MQESCPHGNSLADYKATGPLGAGSLGHVFEVQCKKCNKGFALKIIEKAVVASRGLIPKLISEIDLHQKLKHERILELYTSFEDDDCVYLLLELCKNGDLLTFINSKGALPEQDAKFLFKQIAEGVKYLHDNQIIHRDLKPTNILLTEQGNIKIGDFGVAVQLKDLSEEHETMCGTANYISPEIVSKQPHGIETDIWSLGCVLYALLVGKPPFESGNSQETMKKVMQGEYSFPIGLSEEITDLLKKTMNYNPKERLNIDQILQTPCILESTCTSNCTQILSTNNIAPPYIKKPKSPTEEKQIQPIQNTIKAKVRTAVTEEKTVKKIPFLDNDPKYAKNVPNLIKQQYRDKENIDKNMPSSAKKSKIELKCLNTERLKPILHTTPHGYIKITDNGYIEMEIDNKAKILKITPNGQKIMLFSKLVEDCTIEYDLLDLPHRLHPCYKYASDFVNVLRSKTPKVILKCTEYKFLLMENEPCHNCELFMSDGTKAVHIIGSPKIDIITSDSRKIRVDHMEDYEFLSPEMQKVIDILFNSIKKCVEVEEIVKLKSFKENTKKIYPINIKPDTDIHTLIN